MSDLTISPALLQLLGVVVGTIVSALVGLFRLLYRSQVERCTRAETQVDKILPALEKLTELLERQSRGRS